MTTITIEYAIASGEETELSVSDPGSEYAPLWDDVRQAMKLIPDDAIVTGISINGTPVELP